MKQDLIKYVFLLALFSCRGQIKEAEPTRKTDSSSVVPASSYIKKGCDTCRYSLRNNAKVCDTCLTTIIVHHDECTECRDIYVDSGTVYLDHQTVRYFDSLAKSRIRPADEIGTFDGLINTVDMYLEKSTDYKRLWKFPDAGDLYKKYRLTGRIVLNKKNQWIVFKIKHFTLLDSVYSKRFGY
jgi:hypothetical protein